MNIEINRDNASTFIVQSRKFLWKLYARKVLVIISLLFLCGLLLFISGLTQGYDSSTTTSRMEFHKDVPVTYVHTVLYNYHINFGLGIAFLLFCFYLAYFYLVRQRKHFFMSVNKAANRHQAVSEDYILKVNDEGIYFKDFEITRQERWSVFLKYGVYENWILLMRSELSIDSFIIDKRELSSDDLASLLNFLKSHLPEQRQTFLSAYFR